MANPLLSELPFGSYLVYSPKGTSETSVRSRQFRDAIKAGREDTIRAIVAHLKARFETTPLSDVLGPDVSLVPAPRSSLLVAGALWPPRRIAEELVAAGLGKEVVPCLERTEAVPKSAFQKPDDRPNARRHYDTIAASSMLVSEDRLTVVDDFLTLGNTLLGAGSRLAEAYPGKSLGAFMLVRTKGFVPEIAELVEPCTGRIHRVRENWANRNP